MASLNFLPSPQKIVNSEKSDSKFGYFLLYKMFVRQEDYYDAIFSNLNDYK